MNCLKLLKCTHHISEPGWKKYERSQPPHLKYSNTNIASLIKQKSTWKKEANQRVNEKGNSHGMCCKLFMWKMKMEYTNEIHKRKNTEIIENESRCQIHLLNRIESNYPDTSIIKADHWIQWHDLKICAPI